jgi:hypothetical protein
MILYPKPSASFAALGLVAVVVASLALGADVQRRPHSSQSDPDAAPLCTAAPDPAEPSFYSEMRTASARMHRDMAIAGSGDIDRDFALMMIPHHRGAIDMALLQLKYGHDEKLRRLAQSIIIEQGQEIAYMRTLLDPPADATSVTRRVPAP